MKQFLLIPFFIFTAVFGQDSIKKLPVENVLRVRKIDVTHIALNLQFDWKKRQASGIAAITLATLNATNKINLDAGMLTINSITANGKALQFNYDGGDKYDNLEIILDRSYKANETLILKIDYHTNYINDSDPNNIWGSFGKGLRFFEPTATNPTKRKQIWSSGEPDANRYWFPCLESLDDLHTTEISATVEKPLMVISNGILIETKNNPNGTRTFHYKTEKPYPNYLTSIVVGDYVDVNQNYKNVPLHTFGYPDEKAAIEATTVRLPDMVKFFSETTGLGYPYPHYTQTVVQDYPFPGLNGQHMAVIQSDNMIDDFRTHADFYYLWDGIESEALASQWFGNLITPRDWKDIWLNESFAHYMNGLYTDYKNGHDEYLTYYQTTDMGTILGDWNSGYKHPIVTKNYDNLAWFTADNYVKIRGAMVLRMLRKELGEANWKKVLQYYVKSNAGKQVETADLQKAIKAITGDSMQWFFDQWIYKVGFPMFEVTKDYDAAKKQLTFHVRQTQKLDSNEPFPQVEFFKGKIEIEIDGRIESVLLESKAENIFTFNAPNEPKLVNFDFENTWIRQLKFDKSFDELLYQLESSKDILGKWSAIDELVKIAKDDKTSIFNKERIYTSFRNVIQSQSYWRLRGYALSQLRGIMKAPYDEVTIAMLLKIIKEDKPWPRTAAITFLGMTKDPKYADLYINAFNDQSERVINAAANALGKSKSPKAFEALVKLANKPSWKSQSLISTLNGLKELGDPRGFDIANQALSDIHSPRWFLATPIWDYPIAAAQTIVALGKSEAVFPMILERFKKSMTENDVNDIFANVVLITTLADARGQEAFDLLKVRFKDDANAMQAVNQYESQFTEAIKKPN